MTTILETFGTVQADGTTMKLEQKLLPGRVKVRVEFVKPPATQADWDEALKAAAAIGDEDYDFDALQRQRDCDLQDAKGQLS